MNTTTYSRVSEFWVGCLVCWFFLRPPRYIQQAIRAEYALVAFPLRCAPPTSALVLCVPIDSSCPCVCQSDGCGAGDAPLLCCFDCSSSRARDRHRGSEAGQPLRFLFFCLICFFGRMLFFFGALARAAPLAPQRNDTKRTQTDMGKKSLCAFVYWCDSSQHQHST